MIRVSKNMKRGTLINDLNEIVQLAEDKCSVVIYFGKHTCKVLPAAVIINWPLRLILRYKIFNALKINEKEK